MHYDMKACGQRIRQLRIKAGYTQEKLAEKLDIDRSFYGRIESGKKGCSIDLYIRLSYLFNVSLDYLVLGRNPVLLPNSADKEQLKGDIEELICRLQRLSKNI